jgi:hypothetical protein
MRYLGTLVALLLISLSSVTARAQVGAVLSGAVSDPNGGVVPNVQVTLRDVNTNTQRLATTDAEGRYVFSEVSPGSYELTARCNCRGFDTVVMRLSVSVGQAGVLDIILPVASVTSEVRVLGEAPLVDATKTEVSQVIPERQIENLPVGGRNFVDFVLLSPSVVIGRSNRNGGAMLEPDVGVGATAVTRLSFGGQQEYFTFFAVDGVDNNQVVTRLQRVAPPIESVKEFRIINSSYTTEYGRSLGGIVNIVTKQGGNSFHGSLYNFFRNNALDARNPLAVGKGVALRQDQFGGTLSGPMRKGQTFFFVNYEEQRRAEAPTYPQFVLNNIGAINAVKRSFGLSAEDLSALRTNDYRQLFGRLDHSFSNSQTGMLRYSLLRANNKRANGDFGRNATLPSSDRDNRVDDQSFVGSWVSTISPKLVGEARGQWSRRNYDFAPVSAEPTLEIPNLLVMGHTHAPFDFYHEGRLELAASLTQLAGNHYFKYGINFNRVGDYVLFPAFASSRVIFAGLPGFLGQPPFSGPTVVALQWLSVPPQRPPADLSFRVAYPPEWKDAVGTNIAHQYWGFYAQDHWRVSQRLNLTYGLRYDFEVMPRQFFARDLNNFQPRAGFSYSLNKSGRFVLRGGGGLFYDKYSVMMAVVSRQFGGRGSIAGLPNNVDGSAFVFSLSGPPLATPAFLTLVRTGVFPAPTLPVKQLGIGKIDNARIRTPYSTQGSLQLELNLGGDAALSVGYLVVKGTRLPKLIGNLNALPTGALAPNGTPLLAGRRDPLVFDVFFESADVGNSIYHGGFLTLGKRFSKHYGFDLNYTFSKTIDDGHGFGFGDVPQNVYDMRSERALSQQHVAHRFIASSIAESPFRARALRDLRFSLVLTAESPRYFTVFAGSDLNADGNPVTDRPALNGAPLGRNTFKGDNLVNLDVKLARTFNLGERFSLESALDVFNLLNTFNIRDFNTVYGRPDMSLPPTGILTFGTPRQVYSARHLQIGLKLKF